MVLLAAIHKGQVTAIGHQGPGALGETEHVSAGEEGEDVPKAPRLHFLDEKVLDECGVGQGRKVHLVNMVVVVALMMVALLLLLLLLLVLPPSESDHHHPTSLHTLLLRGGKVQ